MKRSIRPSTPSDAPAIAALLVEVGLRPNIQAEDQRWKYWATRSDWPAPRSYVLTSDEVVVAHAAFVPGAILTPDQRVTSAHVIDWVARRGQAGAGVALMKHIGQQVGALLAFGGSDDTLRILPQIGFVPAGTVTGYSRPLFPLRMLNSDVLFSPRVLPRLARNLAWKAMAPRLDVGGWRARAILDEAGVVGLAACLPKVTDGSAVLERTPALLRYMLGCTIVRTALYAMEKAGAPGGYFMLSFAPGQVRIVDCWMNSRDPSDWRAMFNSAVAYASRDPGAAEIGLWATHPLQHSVLQTCGFRPRFNLPIQIRRSAGDAIGPVVLNVQMLDNDAAYLHEGTSTHWI